MKRTGLLLVGTTLAGCAAPVVVATPPAPLVTVASPNTAELVQARQAGMHMAATLLYQGILPRAKGNGALKDVHYSEGIEMWAAAIPGLFPVGSEHPQSRAMAAIWADKPDFNRKAAELGAAAAQVTAAGKAENLAAYAATSARMQAACSSCHKAYRSE